MSLLADLFGPPDVRCGVCRSGSPSGCASACACPCHGGREPDDEPPPAEGFAFCGWVRMMDRDGKRRRWKRVCASTEHAMCEALLLAYLPPEGTRTIDRVVLRAGRKPWEW